MSNQLAILDGALSIERVVEFRQLIEQSMSRVMKEAQHYGTIPGCGDKPTLLQPGAQLLCTLFRLRPEYDITENDLPGGHKRFRITCRLFVMGDPPFSAGEGIGEASSMESKHRFRPSSRQCPDCGKETIIKGKAEYGGGWLCFQKKGGCGTKWPDGASIIEAQPSGQKENPNPADVFNTVLKMAKKRAFVDATITATSSSDFFTQDLEDIRENIETLNQAHAANGSSEPATEPTRADASKPQEASERRDSMPEAEKHQKTKDALIAFLEVEQCDPRSFLNQAHESLGTIGEPFPSFGELPLPILLMIWKARKAIVAAMRQPAQQQEAA